MKKKLLTGLTTLAASASPLVALGEGWDVTAPESSGLPPTTVKAALTSVMEWLASILAIVGVIGFLVSGIIYITSAGNEDRMELAKRGMVYSIIGLVVGLLGFAVVRTLDTVIRGN